MDLEVPGSRPGGGTSFSIDFIVLSCLRDLVHEMGCRLLEGADILALTVMACGKHFAPGLFREAVIILYIRGLFPNIQLHIHQ